MSDLASLTQRQGKYHRQGWLLGRELAAGGTRLAAGLPEALAEAFDLPAQEAVRRTLADYEHRLNAQPPLAQYPQLRGMRECVMAYNQGMAQGLNAPLEDVILRANFVKAITDAYRLRGGGKPAPTSEPGCTLVYFPTSELGPLIANNQDGLAQQQHRQPPEWIVANRAGIILGTVSSGLYGDEASPQEFPAPVFLMVYELCATTAQAVDLLTNLNLFWGPCNTLVADAQGDSAIIEKSTCRVGVRLSTDGFSATTEMSAEEPAFKAYLWETRRRSLAARGLDQHSADWAYWQAAEKRSARLLGLVEAARSKATLAAMESIIYDHGDCVEQIHMDGRKCHPDQEGGEWSLRTTIWMPAAKESQFSFAQPPLDSRHTPRQRKSYHDVELVF